MATGTIKRPGMKFDTLYAKQSISEGNKTLLASVDDYDFLVGTVYDGTGASANGMSYIVPKPLYALTNKFQIPATDSTGWYIRLHATFSGTTMTVSALASAGYGGRAFSLIGCKCT